MWLNVMFVSSPPNRQEALLAAISEKDANIALLELSSSKKKKTQDEVSLLKREKDRLVQQLKQQVRRWLLVSVEGKERLKCSNSSGSLSGIAHSHVYCFNSYTSHTEYVDEWGIKVRTSKVNETIGHCLFQ